MKCFHPGTYYASLGEPFRAFGINKQPATGSPPWCVFSHRLGKSILFVAYAFLALIYIMQQRHF